MLSSEKRQQLRESIRTLVASQVAMVTEIEEMISCLLQASEIDETPPKVSEHWPVADISTFCVVWEGRTCFLGNTLLFWLFHRLAQSPNGYVAHVDLLDDVWKGNREASSIRGVAKRLRDRLVAAGMQDLARAIDGTVSGYYGLMLV